MAKRRHHKKRTHRRKRSHMGATSSNLTTVLSMVAGAVAGRVLQTKLQDKVNPKILAGGQIIAGMFLPKFVKGKIGAGVGSGMVVNGGVTLLNQFGAIASICGTDAEIEYIGEYPGDDMGYADSSIAGDLDEGTMSGDDDEMGFADSSIAGYDY